MSEIIVVLRDAQECTRHGLSFVEFTIEGMQ